MTRALASLAAAAFALAGLATSAAAELPVGEEAPAFTTQAALAGKEFGFSLSAALAQPEGREAAAVTFLTTASGLVLFGVGGAFWGLAAGGTHQPWDWAGYVV